MNRNLKNNLHHKNKTKQKTKNTITVIKLTPTINKINQSLKTLFIETYHIQIVINI